MNNNLLLETNHLLFIMVFSCLQVAPSHAQASSSGDGGDKPYVNPSSSFLTRTLAVAARSNPSSYFLTLAARSDPGSSLLTTAATLPVPSSAYSPSFFAKPAVEGLLRRSSSYILVRQDVSTQLSVGLACRIQVMLH